MKRPPDSLPNTSTISDAELLSKIGYSQELKRCMRGFSNFSVSFSIICILAGCLTSFHLAFGVGGSGGVAVGWLLGGIFALVIGASMAQIASAYPTAGGLYHWSTILGGRCWGWLNAWVNLFGCIFVVASVNVGVYLLAKNLIFTAFLGEDTSRWGTVVQIIAVALISISQAMLNHFGVTLARKMTDFSGVLILICTIVLIALLLANLHHPLDLTRLVRVENLTGQSGGNVVPHTASLILPFCMSLLLPLYTITGFDGSAHIAEETINAQSTVPKAIMYAILWAVLLGGFLVCCFVLTFVDVHQAARQGDQAIFRLFRDLPMVNWMRGSLYIAIVAANYFCGLAAVTSTSRLVFAFARDGGLPTLLRHVKAKTQCPVAAVWATAFVSILATLYAPAFQVLASGCAVLLYIAYAMPIAAAFLAEQRGWSDFGPFRLCRFSRPFAMLSVAGVLFATYLGLRPPNTVLRGFFLFLMLLLLCLWIAFARKAFAGPKVPVSIRRQASVRS